MSAKCPVCTKPVYMAEERKAIGKTFHKLCLKCSSCNKLLDSTSVNDHEGSLFCNSCYGKNFGPSGYGFAAGGAGLSANAGKQSGGSFNGHSGNLGPKIGGADACPRCNRAVYFAEEARAGGKKYHKACLSCFDCKKKVDSTNITVHNDEIYCKSCYGKNYGPRGYGFAGGSAGLSMDTGRPGEVTRDNVSSYSKAQVMMDSKGNEDKSSKFGGADRCPRCSKAVYFAEKVVAGGRSWHKLCFRCEDCNKGLESTTVCEAGDKIVCKSCYSKSYGPKGFGFGALNNTE